MENRGPVSLCRHSVHCHIVSFVKVFVRQCLSLHFGLQGGGGGGVEVRKKTEKPRQPAPELRHHRKRTSTLDVFRLYES